MAKRNAKTDTTVVEQPSADVQTVQEGSGNTNDTPLAQEQPEGSKEELQVQPEQGGGEQTDGEGNPGLDSESQEETVVQEGSGTGDQVTDNDQELDEETEETYREAKEVIKGLVSEVLGENGLIEIVKVNESNEKTEKRNRIAADVFSKHSHRKTLYFTSDMIPFFEKSDANRHASTLKDNTVVTINKK